jgi:hypothetical protein
MHYKMHAFLEATGARRENVQKPCKNKQNHKGRTMAPPGAGRDEDTGTSKTVIKPCKNKQNRHFQVDYKTHVPFRASRPAGSREKKYQRNP